MNGSQRRTLIGSAVHKHCKHGFLQSGHKSEMLYEAHLNVRLPKAITASLVRLPAEAGWSRGSAAPNVL